MKHRAQGGCETRGDMMHQWGTRVMGALGTGGLLDIRAEVQGDTIHQRPKSIRENIMLIACTNSSGSIMFVTCTAAQMTPR